MNIAIISDYNIGGIPTYLMRAINKYTDHKARCIIAKDDSFAFDRDIFLSSPEGMAEATDWVKQCEFFHFGRGVFNWPGIDWNGFLNKTNCCVEYYGSELRNNYQTYQKFHERTGISAITGTDWTITGRLPNSFYHLGQYFTKFGDMAFDDIPVCNFRTRGDILKIAIASAGSPLKGYDYLAQVIYELQQEGVPVELIHMYGISNKEVLEEKLKCHATFTSLHGGWGMSGIESMFIGHTILSCLDAWTMSLYPNSPTVIVNKDTLKDEIRKLEANHFQLMGRTFAFENFNTKTILKRYLYLWDLIRHKEEYLDGNKTPEIIYDKF